MLPGHSRREGQVLGAEAGKADVSGQRGETLPPRDHRRMVRHELGRVHERLRDPACALVDLL